MFSNDAKTIADVPFPNFRGRDELLIADSLISFMQRLAAMGSPVSSVVANRWHQDTLTDLSMVLKNDMTTVNNPEPKSRREN